LSEAYGVSRSTVRAALVIVQNLGRLRDAVVLAQLSVGQYLTTVTPSR